MADSLRQSTLAEAWRLCGLPERIVWAVAAHEGRRSICPLGWKMHCSGTPPMVAVAMATTHFSYELIVKSGELVLAWPGEDLAEATHFCGTRSGREVDKLDALALHPLPASTVKAPLIAECAVCLECRLRSQMQTGDHAILACEVVASWVNASPRRLLCSVGIESGYEVLLHRGGWRFGVVRR